MLRLALRRVQNYVLPDATPKVQKSLALNSNSRDVVVLLGWGGAKHKNLRKILNYYQEKDVSVVSCVMPQFVPTFVRTHYESEIARLVSEIRKDDTNKQSKLYGHIFSNNGTWTFATLCQRKDIPSFDKLVIDSAPAFYYKRIPIYQEVKMIARVMTSVVLQRPQYDHYVITPLVKSLLLVIIPIWRLTNIVQSIIDEDILPDYRKLNTFMRDSSPNIPTYFIYSIGDRLVPFESVREFKKYLDARNVPTFERVFGEDTPHTAAFYRYPEEYKEVLDVFFCLKKDNITPQAYYRE